MTAGPTGPGGGGGASQQQSASSSSASNTGTIAGAVVGAVVGIGALVAVFVYQQSKAAALQTAKDDGSKSADFVDIYASSSSSGGPPMNPIQQQANIELQAR